MNQVNSHLEVGYAEYVVSHPIVKFTYQVTIEIVKVIAAKIFLVILSKQLLKETAKYTRQYIAITTVLGPVIEEVIFRGIIQRGIHAIQGSWNRLVTNHDLTEEEKRTQQFVRIHLSAFLFGLAHINNPHPHVMSRINQMTWCYLAGVAYGYLSEKYQTLSLSILAHGINNSLAVACSIYSEDLMPFFVIAAFANKISVCIMANVNPISEAGEAIKSCLSGSERMIRYCFSSVSE